MSVDQPQSAPGLRATILPGGTAASVTHSGDIARVPHLLEELDVKFGDVRIGSYPKKDDEGYYVLVVLKSKDGGRLEAAAAWLAERLPV